MKATNVAKSYDYPLTARIWVRGVQKTSTPSGKWFKLVIMREDNAAYTLIDISLPVSYVIGYNS